MCDKRVKVLSGIGAVGVYRCRRDHPAALEMYRAGQTTLHPEIHEAGLGWGGATVRWDDCGWQTPGKEVIQIEVEP